MNKIERVTKPLTWSMTILMAAILAGCGGGTSSPAATAPGASGALGTASALGSTVIPPNIAVANQTVGAAKATAYSIVPTTPSITVSGNYPKLVSPVLTGKGFINVVNNVLAHVAATQTGTGTVSVVNNGAVLAATNTGTGVMNVNNGATSCSVAVTNVGNGNITVTAANSDCPAPIGQKTFALTYTDGLNHIYPAANTAFGSSLGASTNNANIHVSGSNAGNVISVLTDPSIPQIGSITVVNNGAHVAATQTGAGAINVTNNGQVLAATNTGTGLMTINSTDTGAVAVTRTGNGNTTVTASGTTPLKLSFHGDGDVTYPLTALVGAVTLGSSLGANANITVSGLYANNVTPVLKGNGSINVVNNVPQHVAATEIGTGAINIVNSGIGSVLTATNTGNGVMTINSTATAAVTVTNTYVAGHGSPANNITVNASGSTAIACNFIDGLDHNVIGSGTSTACATLATVPAALGSSLGASGALIIGVTVDGSNMGAVTTVINDPTGLATIAVHNNGSGFDSATENTATGFVLGGGITINNTGAGVTATNNGNGVMSISSTDTAQVTVTNTGNGNVTVTAGGSDPITLTHVGDDDFVYPVAGSAAPAGTSGLGTPLGGALGSCPTANSSLFGSNAGAISATITQPLVGGVCGFINATDNGSGAVTATETGAGTVNVVASSAGVTATNTGDGVMTVTSTDSAQVTVTNTGNGNVSVTATGTSPLILTYTDGLDHTYP